MASRRQFTFGSLVLALTGSQAARAGGPRQGSAPLPFRWAATSSRKGQVLTVNLTVQNTSKAPVEVVTQLGDGPGAWLSAAIDIEGETLDLAPIYEGNRRRMMMSRMGPIPQWGPLVSGAPLALGPYRFAWPKGVPTRSVALLAELESELGMAQHRMTVHPSTPGDRTS